MIIFVHARLQGCPSVLLQVAKTLLPRIIHYVSPTFVRGVTQETLQLVN